MSRQDLRKWGAITMKTLPAAMLVLVGLASGASHAARALDMPPPTAAAVRNTPQPAAAAQSDDRSSLRQGLVTEVSDVSADAARVQINGTWLRVGQGTRLFRQGRPVAAGALAKGQWLQFTLSPGAADRNTLGVVYVP